MNGTYDWSSKFWPSQHSWSHVQYLQSGHLAIGLYLGHMLCLAVTWSSFATFHATGKSAEKVKNCSQGTCTPWCRPVAHACPHSTAPSCTPPLPMTTQHHSTSTGHACIVVQHTHPRAGKPPIDCNFLPGSPMSLLFRRQKKLASHSHVKSSLNKQRSSLNNGNGDSCNWHC